MQITNANKENAVMVGKGTLNSEALRGPKLIEQALKRAGFAYARRLADSLLYSYSTLLFMRNRGVGAILLFTTFANPNLAVSGIVSWLATILFAKAIAGDLDDDDPTHAVYTYNSLLAGFSVGFLFKVSFLSIMLTIGTSIFTFLLSHALYTMLTRRAGLPVLNIPFVVAGMMVWLASVRYSSLFVDSFYPFGNLNIDGIPASIQGLLRAAGILVFMPYDLSGMLVLGALLLSSRILFFLAVSSYFSGMLVLAMLKGGFAVACPDYSSFNFILIGMTLGGVFLVPSGRSYVYAGVGVFVSVFALDAISVAWSAFGVPVFTLPYNIIVLLLVYVLANLGYPKINRAIGDTPEKSLAAHLNFARRFDRATPQPYLPFVGKWSVYQGFNGQWTHKGPWKYAYDFVITDESGLTHKNEGLRLEDYHCYGKPVFSPVGGVVADAYDELPDNPPGRVDKSNNWGNYIIIRCQTGYYVEISHLRNKSLKVAPGDVVQPGAYLAACGNSGYSPEPHIHMQVQYLPQLGSETVPFYFGNCVTTKDMRLAGNAVLEQGTVVESAVYSRKKANILTFILDDSFEYDVFENGKKASRIRLRVAMETDGAYCFQIDGTNDKLRFGIENNRFVCYSFEGKTDSPLKHIFAALPKVPFFDGNGLTWEENLPDNLAGSDNGLRLFYKSFNHDYFNISGVYAFADTGEVVGTIPVGGHSITTKAVFDQFRGISEIGIQMSRDTRYEMRMVK